MQNESNYLKYRGKCKEYVDAAIVADSTLRAVRGYYHCPIWGKQQHWWCKRPDGSIFDPTAKQFPSGGIKEFYEEFNGIIHCSQCGKEMKEDEAHFESNSCFCSGACHMLFVGL